MRFIFILSFLFQALSLVNSSPSIIEPVYGMNDSEFNGGGDEGVGKKEGNEESLLKGIEPEKLKNVSGVCTNRKLKGKRPFLSFSLPVASDTKITNLLKDLNEDIGGSGYMSPIGVREVQNLHATISMSKFPFMKIGEGELGGGGLLDSKLVDEFIELLNKEEKILRLDLEDAETIDMFLPLISKYNMLDILRAQSQKPEDFESCQLEYADYYFYKVLEILLEKAPKTFKVKFIPTIVEALGKQNRFITIRGTYETDTMGLDNLVAFLNLNTSPHISLLKYDNNVQAKIVNVLLSTYYHREIYPLVEKYFILVSHIDKSDQRNNVGLCEEISHDLYNPAKYEEISDAINNNFKKTLLHVVSQILRDWKDKLKENGKESFYDEVMLELMNNMKEEKVDNLDSLENLGKFLTSMHNRWTSSVSQISASIIDKIWEKYKEKDVAHGDTGDKGAIPPVYSIKAIFNGYRGELKNLFELVKNIKEIISQCNEQKWPSMVKGLIEFIRNQDVGMFYAKYKKESPESLVEDIMNIFPDIKKGRSAYIELLTLIKNHQILSTIQSQASEIRNYQALSMAADELNEKIKDYLSVLQASNGIGCSNLRSNLNEYLKGLSKRGLEEVSNEIKFCAIANFLKAQYEEKRDPRSRIKAYLRKQNPKLKFDNIIDEVGVNTSEELIASLFYTKGNYDFLSAGDILKKVNAVLKSYGKIIESKGVKSIEEPLKKELIEKLVFDNSEDIFSLGTTITSPIEKDVINTILKPEKRAFKNSEMRKELDIKDMEKGSLRDRVYLSRLIVRNLMRLYEVLLDVTGNPTKVINYGDYINIAAKFFMDNLEKGDSELKVIDLEYGDSHKEE